MAENPDEPVVGTDVRTIRHLVRLMHRYDLTAIDLAEGTTRIRLRRQTPGSAAVPYVAPPPLAAPVAVPMLAPTASPAPVASAPPPAAPKTGPVIESPMVGTFYSSSSPDSPPFVSVGSVVRADSTVGVIEAMKVFTEIPAGLAGTITEVLVKNGQALEFGQPLFRLDPS